MHWCSGVTRDMLRELVHATQFKICTPKIERLLPLNFDYFVVKIKIINTDKNVVLYLYTPYIEE